jgi:hypothetical protein
MGTRPATRRAALLEEVCIRYGYCNTVDESALAGSATAEEVVRAIVLAEARGPETLDRHEHAALIEIADDWLFSPDGRGAQSGLPR